jgi:hypothetical protein
MRLGSTWFHSPNRRYHAVFSASIDPYFFCSQLRNRRSVCGQKQNSGFGIHVGLAQLMTWGSLHRSQPRNAGLRRARSASAA